MTVIAPRDAEASALIDRAAECLRQAAKVQPKHETELWALASRAESVRAEILRFYRILEENRSAAE